MSFVIVLIATAAIANNGNSKNTFLNVNKVLSDEKSIVIEKNENLRVHSCTATATITINGVSTTFSNTITCDCSNSTACSQANAGNTAAITAYVYALAN